jgi:hypothetical protein
VERGGRGGRSRREQVNLQVHLLDFSELLDDSCLIEWLPNVVHNASQAQLENFLLNMFALRRLPSRCCKIPVCRTTAGQVHFHTCPGFWRLELPECDDMGAAASLFSLEHGLAFSNV